MKCILFLALTCIIVVNAQEFSPTIEDNSFFIEEAYNQEEHVVQHIFTINSSHGINLFETSFTQEWPAFSQTHQLSFTLPFQFSIPKTITSNGIGDLLLNYRYQLVNENELAIAPRVSIILPTGDEAKGFGNAVVGMQFNLSVSKRFSNEIVTHYNAGLTAFPNVQFTTSKATITEYFFGASGIYLANKHFNTMVEILYTSSGSKFERTNELIISPGVRWAIDIGDLQIVPGMAFPFNYNSNPQNVGLLFYFSFEHSY